MLLAKSRALRRAGKVAMLLALMLAAVGLNRLLSLTVRSAAYCWGWLLLGSVVFLALYSLRKRWVHMPCGSSAAWLQLHIYLGLFSSVVCLLHTGLRLPDGVFESLLAAVYWAVFFSGVAGLVISRTFAWRLTARGAEVIYERIPEYVDRLRTEVERGLADRGDTSPLVHLYRSQLAAHFAGPRHFFHHLLGSTRPQQTLLRQVQSYQRYVTDTERDLLTALENQVRMKGDLDYQYSLQFMLKHWPFVHVPLTYSLLLLSLYHVFLVHAFMGSR